MDLPYEMLFTLVYTLVDDWYRAAGAALVRARPGAKLLFSDSEVLAVELVRSLEGQTSERRWYRTVRANWCGLFPRLPERSVLHKGEHGLEDHGARSWWGLLTRLASLLAAFTLARYCLHHNLIPLA